MTGQGQDEKILLRPYQGGDLPQLQDIAIAAWKPVFDSFANLMGPVAFGLIYSDWQSDKRRQIASACEGEHGARVLVAVQKSTPVGFISYYLDHPESVGEIGNNAVHPDHQGRGIGTRMYNTVLAKMREGGMQCARVTTGGDPAHAPARRAYAKAGFHAGVPSITYHIEL
jgi:RimJ/RimL family protein N-acetyltransferase